MISSNQRWFRKTGSDLGSTAHAIYASGHALLTRPSSGSARTTSPIEPSRMISTRRGARVVAVASEAAIKASINDDNGAPSHSKARPQAETTAIVRTKGPDHKKPKSQSQSLLRKVYYAKS